MNAFLLRISLSILIIGLFSACENSDSGDDGGFDGATVEELSDASAYKADSPWAGDLKACVMAKTVEDSCTLGTLPLIGMESSNPSVDLIMDRVVVSHDWMGERLEELFLALPDEILLLTRSITAIVADDDIRPAYYDPRTGAIYIDPNFLWLNASEASTVSTKDDFRSGFSRPLDFRSFGRYVKDDASAFIYRTADNPVTRSLSDIEYLFASLIVHELAHANDYFPPALHNSIPNESQPWPAAFAQQASWVSTSLNNSQGLNSQTLFGLANVMYRGETATTEQREISAEQVGSIFESDSASDTYAYSTEREDVAMLFEEVMMYHLFGIERDLTFVTAPEEGANRCEDYPVGWGSRMRVATSQVATRAQFVVEQILPEVDTQAIFEGIPETRLMPDGLDWCTSLVFERASSETTQQKTQLADDISTYQEPFNGVPRHHYHAHPH